MENVLNDISQISLYACFGAALWLYHILKYVDIKCTFTQQVFEMV